MFGDDALDQIACYYRLTGARRRHNEDLSAACRKLALDLFDGGPLELMQDDAGDVMLKILGRPGVYLFDRTAKLIFLGSPVVRVGRRTSCLWSRRPRPIRQSPEKPFGF